ncbi:MAG: DUF4446 family protein [Candidatus Niyogibacteria bacterium]|nr:MAG: DUF4446 family protein [Candidatus Niyogibacteria bacterium]
MIFGEQTEWFVITALIAAVFSVVWIIFLELRLKKLFRGSRAENLQNVLAEIQKELKYFSEKEKEIDDFLGHVERRLNRSAQHLGIVRFNPYSGVGGEQSFAIAVLDEKMSGFVVSGLYGREQSRVYAKPIEHGKSPHKLSDEEKEAIEKAVNRYA